MNPIQARLKSEPFAAVFEIAGKTFKPISVAYLLYSIALMAIMVPFFVLILDIDIQSLVRLMEVSDPLQRSTMAEDLFAGFGQSIGTQQVIGIILMTVIMILAASWFYNFCFIAVEGYIRGRNTGLSEILSKSFNVNIIWLTFASVVIVILVMLVSIGIGLLTAASGNFGFLVAMLGSIIAVALLMRFIILLPAIVHGSMSVGEALGYSWSVIGFVRGLKYFGISLVVMIALFVLLFVMGMVQAGLMAIPVIGFVLYILFSLLWGGFMSAWFTAIQSGLYFRHLPDEEYRSDMNIEDHLIA
jgi:hypothetical protein